MILDKELELVSDWLVIDISHERYSFETSVNLYYNRSLKELFFYDLMIPREELEEHLEKQREENYPDEYNYNYDRCGRSPLDTKYSFPYLSGLPLLDIHLDTLHIVDMNCLRNGETANFIWGSTDKKFGLIDVDREAFDKNE